MVTKGHQFPHESYLEAEICGDQNLHINLQNAVDETVKANPKVKRYEINENELKTDFSQNSVPGTKMGMLGVCEIEGFKPVPCGGTHVKTIADIGRIIITKIKSKGDKIKISYEIKEIA